MSETTKYKLSNLNLSTGWSYGEDYWGDDVNDNFIITDTLCQAIIKKFITELPTSYNPGDGFILNTKLSDELPAGSILIYRDNDTYITLQPKNGWRIFNQETNEFYYYLNSSWKNEKTLYSSNVGSSTNFGSVKLSDSITSTNGVSNGIAATPLSVKTVNDSAVHKTGNESISGNKTFNDKVIVSGNDISIIDKSIKKDEIVIGRVGSGLWVYDKTGIGNENNKIGGIESTKDENNLIETRMYSYDTNSSNNAYIGIHYPVSGSPYATAPTPQVNYDDRSNKITTTEWVSSAITDLTKKVTINGQTLFDSDNSITITDISGNSGSASRLETPRTINGTSFDGLEDIVTEQWGTSRNISISDNTAINTGSSVSVDGSSAVVLKLPSTIKADLTGNSDTSTKLETPRSINGTQFDGSTDIVTNQWGTSRNISIGDDSSTNIGSSVPVDGSDEVVLKLPQTIKADLTGNSDTSTKLETARSINGTLFDGTSDIVTEQWGKSRNISISDNTATNTGFSVSVDGSSAVVLKLPSTIKADLTGNSDTSTKLKSSRTINGTSFDGSSNIVTEYWGTSRNISISDSESINTGSSVPVNGSDEVVLKLPSTIKANLTGNSDTSTKLETPRTINGTEFDGSKNIITSKWGTARNISITDSTGNNTGEIISVDGSDEIVLKLPSVIDAKFSGDVSGNTDTATRLATKRTINVTDGTNTGTGASFDGSADVTIKLPTTINASLSGNASTSTKLETPRTINGTSFDGSANIVTENWGTSRNISISDSTSTNTGTPISVNGSSEVVLKLPQTIKANLTGNSDSATKLETPRTINGTEFDGSSNIVTNQWGTSRNISISDSTVTNTSDPVSVNGSSEVVLKLPSTIKANLTGNSDTSTKLKTARSITLNGDVTGSASFDGSQNITIATTYTPSSGSPVTMEYVDNKIEELRQEMNYLLIVFT